VGDYSLRLDPIYSIFHKRSPPVSHVVGDYSLRLDPIYVCYSLLLLLKKKKENNAKIKNIV